LGDSAPTQGEVIQILGQLYVFNLLQGEVPADTQGLFKRYRKRVSREVRGYLTNLLFIKIPVFDPDAFLNRWGGLFGKVFTTYGFVAWLMLLAVGLYFIVGKVEDLGDQAAGILAPDNILLLYVSLVVIKICHEFGHAFACKKFGLQSGTGGETHVMGVMLLVFTPLPYVDATSMDAFRSKWHRAIVGMAGMLVELGIAAVAAIVWANTAKETVPHAVAYNVMFLASIWTVMFNGNPLLRFDGYYILSDLVEIPNLAPRSKQYLYYLVKRYAWGLRQSRSPANTPGERRWMLFFVIASTTYRVFICARILLFITDKIPLLGAVLAVLAVAMWVIMPLGKFVHYLATSGELHRVRPRAVWSTVGTVAAILLGVGMIPAPDRPRVAGVVEPSSLAIVHMGADGFVRNVLPSRREVTPQGAPLVEAFSETLASQRDQLAARRREVSVRLRTARTNDPASINIYTANLNAIDKRLNRLDGEIESLTVRAPFAGTWVSPDIERTVGAYLHRGDKLGLVASMDSLIIRAVAGQDIAAQIIEEIDRMDDLRHVQIRIKGRPDMELSGVIRRILPAGQQQLPSAALGYQVGGSVQTGDPEGAMAVGHFFEIHIEPDPNSPVDLLAGQRVAVRLEMSSKPLLLQWRRWFGQLVQRRFGG
jgi:putative peptide zinc metalloprotease protein